MKDLTDKQRQIMAFIRGTIHGKGRAPSIREIAGEFGYQSPNGALQHLKALERKGLIARDPGARAIRMIDLETAPRLPFGGKVA